MGKVYLIGAGPGDPDLLTVKAARLLERATIVLHDSLVSREVLALIPRTAEIIDVGKRAGKKLLTQDEINQLLIFLGSGRSFDRSADKSSDRSPNVHPPSKATSHNEVIRLKGGDPVVFGRAGEEIEALRRAKIPFEIVPGITAALGAAAAAGISLTDRRTASQIVITTYSRGSDPANADPFAVTPHLDWAAISSSTTLVLYMPGADYAEVSRRLIEAGQPESLPCIVVSNATTPQQKIRWTTVSGLASEAKLPAPALLIVGHVATHEIQEIAASAWPANRKENQVKRAIIS
jgi:uroporphyrin-III C-methyltransferase